MTTYYPVWGIEVTKSHFIKIWSVEWKGQNLYGSVFFCVAVYGENDESLEKQKIGSPNFQDIH